MVQPNDGFHISTNGVSHRIGPADEQEWAWHESLVRTDYDRCHPDETFEDLKHRARFSKEDKGLLRDWMALAAARAAEHRRRETRQPRAAA
jgi:hypothetical protein